MNTNFFSTAVQQIKIAFILFLMLTILTGMIYPLLITVIAQFFFPWQARGSLIEKDGQIIGSALIGQFFNHPKYFWGRPSATSPYPYNAAHSSGSNMGPSNPVFLNDIKNRVSELQKQDPTHLTKIPVDLVTASASGLDPDISILAAFYQVNRIAKARNISPEAVQNLILNLQKKRNLFFFSESRVNVLQLNLALDVGDLQTKSQ